MPQVTRDHLLDSLQDLGVVNIGIERTKARPREADITIVLQGGIDLEVTTSADYLRDPETIVAVCRRTVEEYLRSHPVLAGHDLDRLGDYYGLRRYLRESDAEYRERIRGSWHTGLQSDVRQRIRDAWSNTYAEPMPEVTWPPLGVAENRHDGCYDCGDTHHAPTPAQPPKSRYTRLLEGVL